MKLIVTANTTCAEYTLRDALTSGTKGDIFKVIKECSTPAFTMSEYLIKGTLPNEDDMLFSLRDMSSIDEKDIYSSWESVKLIKMPKGFQLTLEQE